MNPRCPKRDFLCLALFGGVALGFFGHPLLWPNYLGYDGDSAFGWYPLIHFAREELSAGRLPIWNPYKFFGVPFLADPVISIFYPPQILGLLPPLAFGHHLVIVLHYAMGGAFMFLLARRGFALSRLAALLAGMTFAFSAPMVNHVVHFNHIRTVIWMPLAWMFALEEPEGKRWWKKGVGLGTALGLEILAGQPQFIFYTAIPLGFVFLGQLWNGRGARARILFAYGIAGVIAFGLGAATLFPMAEFSPLSARSLWTRKVMVQGSLTFKSALSLLIPSLHVSPTTGEFASGPNSEMEIFFGQPALLLALLGIFSRRTDARKWPLVGIALIGWLLAMGDHGPIYDMLGRVFPPVTQFRAPARAFVLALIGAALLAGMGLDALIGWLSQEASGVRKNLIAPFGFGLLVLQLIALAWYRASDLSLPYHDARAVEVAGYESRLPGAGKENWRVFRLMDEVDYLDDSPSAMSAKVRSLQPDLNAVKGFRDILGYEGGLFPPARWAGFMWHFYRNLFSPHPDARLLGLMGVKYILADKPVSGDRLKQIYTDGRVAIFENLDYRGEIFRREDWPGVNFSLLGQSFDRRIPENPVLMDDANEARDSSPTQKPVQRMSYRRIAPAKFEVELPDDSPDEILLSEGWMPGWEAVSESGAKTRGEYVAPFLISFRVPAGARRLTLIYVPHALYVGICISTLTSILVLVSMVGVYFSRRRRRLGLPAERLGDRRMENSSVADVQAAP